MTLAPGKMDFRELDADTQAAVLANRTIPYYEQAITAAATCADQDALDRITREYNEVRGLPVADDTTTGTTDTPDGDTKDDTPEDYKGWNREALENEAVHERDLDVAGTGRDGYVKNGDYRDALVADDEVRRDQEEVAS